MMEHGPAVQEECSVRMSGHTIYRLRTLVYRIHGTAFLHCYANGHLTRCSWRREMLIKEYHIPLPLSLEEYRIAQLYMIQVRQELRRKVGGPCQYCNDIHVLYKGLSRRSCCCQARAKTSTPHTNLVMSVVLWVVGFLLSVGTVPGTCLLTAVQTHFLLSGSFTFLSSLLSPTPSHSHPPEKEP